MAHAWSTVGVEYAHLDANGGKDAATDVYPASFDHLDRFNLRGHRARPRWSGRQPRSRFE
jgi:hypothetical protein